MKQQIIIRLPKWDLVPQKGTRSLKALHLIPVLEVDLYSLSEVLLCGDSERAYRQGRAWPSKSWYALKVFQEANVLRVKRGKCDLAWRQQSMPSPLDKLKEEIQGTVWTPSQDCIAVVQPRRDKCIDQFFQALLGDRILLILLIFCR